MDLVILLIVSTCLGVIVWCIASYMIDKKKQKINEGRDSRTLWKKKY